MTRPSRGIVRAIASLVLAGALAVPAEAQRGQGPRMQNRAELESRIRARFEEMVRERLGLDEEQTLRLAEAVESFRPDRQALAREERVLRGRIETSLREGGTDDAEARELLERVRELRFEEARLFEREQERLLEVLTPSQVLAFHLMREEMGQRVRRLRGGPPGPGGGPGGGPGRLWPAPY